MSDADLVKRLRDAALYLENDVAEVSPALLREAAERIEALEADVERAREAAHYEELQR